MTPEQQELWQRIEAFDIDGGPCALPFAARLRREHGWSQAYADRVIREYKRYVCLSVGGSEPRCPSEDVDAAWHLHLTYTRSYWKRFCGETLGTPLHHEPTRGGPREAEKHRAMYGQTLTAYRETFGQDPPGDIWPPVDQRFGDDLRSRHVNTARHWIIPKQPVRRALQLAVVFFVSTVLLPGCEARLNPFELNGTDFFYVLIPALIGATVLGRMIRSALQRPGPQPGDEQLELTWEQAAWLAGGAPRLTTAAIARLAEADLLRVAEDRLEPGEAPPAHRSPVETVILDHLPVSRSQLKIIQQAVTDRFADQGAELERDGLTLTRSQQWNARLIGLVPLVLVLLGLGLPRLVKGLAANRPVEYLVFALIIGGITGFAICLSGSLLRSRRGQHVLDQTRQRTEARQADTGLAVGLFGTTILTGTALAYLNDWYPRPTSTGADGGCGTGCGGGDGGGGCGGDGGCGGCGGGGD